MGGKWVETSRAGAIRHRRGVAKYFHESRRKQHGFYVLMSKLRTQTTYSNNLKLLHSTCCLSLCARGACMKSLVVKRSVVIAGRKTSVSLEETFWKSLREIGICRNMGLSAMVAAIGTTIRKSIVKHSLICSQLLSQSTRFRIGRE